MGTAPRKHVVIIDDEKSYTRLLAELLSDHLECGITTFTRPRDALAAMPKLNVGVVVTDYFMPQLNGVELILKAAPLLPGVPFILITGHTDGMIDLASLTKVKPLKAILRKPFGWRKLADEIVRLWPERGVDLVRREPEAASV